MDRDRLIFYVKLNNIQKYIGKDVATRFDISNFELDGPLSKGIKNNSLNGR